MRVSIHAPAWGATIWFSVLAAMTSVSIHAPAWGATPVSRWPSLGRLSFNPRARVGRDLFHGMTSRSYLSFQSTRPRGARPPATSKSDGISPVSIHAPAWGATWSRIRYATPAVFQSTRPRGARRPRWWRSPRGARFNPRARVGRDHACGTIGFQHGQFQSTRPRGARLSEIRCCQSGCPGFNPRARVGRDFEPCHFPRGSGSFNPRARVGRDQPVFLTAAHFRAFQSTRPRGARRLRLAMGARLRLVSIHAPAWGATSAMILLDAQLMVFQSTRPRGARL